MSDELSYVLESYKNVIDKNLGNNIAVSFFADSESYADSVSPIIDPLTKYTIGKDTYDVVFYQDFSIDREVVLTDCSVCKIDGKTFVKIITPFTRERSYDFILTKASEAKDILQSLNFRRDKSNNGAINFPIIGLDFEHIRADTIDFLLDEKLRAFCIEKHIKLKRGLIFEGLPGNGKSLSLRWLKQEAEKNNIEFKQFDNPKEFLDERGSYYDRSKKHIFVFEDFDALLQERDNTGNAPNTILSTVLNTLDGVEEITDVVSIFTTNKVELFDSAFIRPGRIDKVIRFEVPTATQRMEFMKAYIPDYEKFFSDIEKRISSKTSSISFAVMKGICDDINIYEFNTGPLSLESIFMLIDRKLTGANKNVEVKDAGAYIL